MQRATVLGQRAEFGGVSVADQSPAIVGVISHALLVKAAPNVIVRMRNAQTRCTRVSTSSTGTSARRWGSSNRRQMTRRLD